MSSVSFADANAGIQVGINNGSINFKPIEKFSTRPDSPPEPLSTVPFARNPGFVDDGGTIDRIREKGESPGSRIALVGLGGVGKTQIAIEYCYQVRERSPDTWVFWINASSVARFENDCRATADIVGLPGPQSPNTTSIRLLFEWLNVQGKRWIIVFDDLEQEFFHDTPAATQSARAIWEDLASLHSPSGQVLVTSRNGSVASRVMGGMEVIFVETMTEALAMTLLSTKLGKEKAEEAEGAEEAEEENKQMIQLVRALGGLPLTIVQAAAYIKELVPRKSIKQYLGIYQEGNQDLVSLLEDGMHTPRDYEDMSTFRSSFERIWQISFEHLKSERPSAMDLLLFMSFFDGDGIPKKLIQEERRTNYDHTSISTRDMVRQADATMNKSNNVEIKETEAFDSDIYSLVSLSLLSTSPDGKQFQMHRLVQLATQTWLRSFGEHEVWKGHFIHSLYINFPPGRFENWTTCGMLFTHVQCAISQRPTKKKGIEQWPDNGFSLKEWGSLLHEAAYFAWARGVVKESIIMAHKAMEARMELLGPEDVYTLSSIEMLALASSLKGKWKEAEELHDQVLEVCQRILPPEHPNTIVVMGNLASTYRNQGRWKEAEVLELQVVQYRRKILGPRHFNTLTSMANLSSTYRYQGRWREAEQLDVQVMEARKQDLGLNHPVTLTSMANLALTYWNQGRGKESEELGVQVVNVRRQVLGPEHPLTLNSMANLASTYWNQERWEDAEELGSQVLEARKRLLGDEHPETLNSMANLASTYGDQGRLVEAEELEVYVLETRKRVLGLEHPDTLTSMANLASTYGDQGRWQEAENLELHVVETSKRVLGLEHPDTLAGMANLASTYKDQNRWKEAKELEMEVMETRKHVLGFEHPDTISSMISLAHTLRSSGRNEVD